MNSITKGAMDFMTPTARISAPAGSYWIYTIEGSRLHHAQPGAVVRDDPYSVPLQWVHDGLVTIEELE